MKGIGSNMFEEPVSYPTMCSWCTKYFIKGRCNGGSSIGLGMKGNIRHCDARGRRHFGERKMGQWGGESKRYGDNEEEGLYLKV